MRSVVQLYPGPPENQWSVISGQWPAKNWQLSADNCQLLGAVAQLGERLVCNQEATGSIPVSSTRNSRIDEAISALSGDRICGLHPMGGLRISCSVRADSVVGSVEWNGTLRTCDLCSVEDISATSSEYGLRKYPTLCWAPNVVRLASNIGSEELGSLHTPGLVRLIPAYAG